MLLSVVWKLGGKKEFQTNILSLELCFYVKTVIFQVYLHQSFHSSPPAAAKWDINFKKSKTREKCKY